MEDKEGLTSLISANTVRLGVYSGFLLYLSPRNGFVQRGLQGHGLTVAFERAHQNNIHKKIRFKPTHSPNTSGNSPDGLCYGDTKRAERVLCVFFLLLCLRLD